MTADYQREKDGHPDVAPSGECDECGGAGFVEWIEEVTVTECCSQFNPDGSCCGDAIPGVQQELHRHDCPKCVGSSCRECGSILEPDDTGWLCVTCEDMHYPGHSDDALTRREYDEREKAE